jgi:hypothetical protein
MYLFSDEMNYNVVDDDNIGFSQSNLFYGHSEGFALNDPLRNFRFDDLGFGADLGLVYEWRPEGEAYTALQAKSRRPPTARPPATASRRLLR